MGRLCYLVQPSGHWSWYFRQGFVPVARQVWRAFCRHGTIFFACRRGRGTSLMRAIYLSPVTNFMRCSGAVRVNHQLQSCHGCRSKSKNRDEPINFIVRVSGCNLLLKSRYRGLELSELLSNCP